MPTITFDSSLNHRAVDAGSRRVTCSFDGGSGVNSTGDSQTSLPRNASGGRTTYVYDSRTLRVIHPVGDRHTIAYGAYHLAATDPSRSPSPPGNHRDCLVVRVADPHVLPPPPFPVPVSPCLGVRTIDAIPTRTTLVVEHSVASRQAPTPLHVPKKLRGIAADEVAEAYGLFVQLRSLVDPADEESLTMIALLRDALLVHPVTIALLRRAARAFVASDPVRRNVLDDILQEAALIIRSRLLSSAVRNEGPGRFIRWLTTVVECACLDAARTPRVKRRSKITYFTLEKLARIIAPEGRNEVDETDFSERLAAAIEAIPDPVTRAAVHDELMECDVGDTAARLGLSYDQAYRLRKRGCKLLRRIWPAGRAGL